MSFKLKLQKWYNQKQKARILKLLLNKKVPEISDKVIASDKI